MEVVTEIGITISALAIFAISLDLRGQPLGPGPLCRLMALVGEILYFTGVMPTAGDVFFLTGAVMTVVLWFHPPDPRPSQKSLIDVSELVAWVWMALTVR
ncbi:MAG: hypothetical protein M1294_00040 [Firmicutes bacterium]|nr:hypothetical protein [Bacillota bacterium]MCL5012601.1 hypothetical protein [Bacillota bacterium]